jgi:dienelactone hydrolase
MRKVRVAVVLAMVAFSAFAEMPAGASEPNPFVGCPPYGDTRICSGTVPSFDGTPLDFDLTEPSPESGPGPHPLIIMLHGLGGDKHEWEYLTDEGDGADKSRWNNHWFAKHGYYVLTYTARGHMTRPVSDEDKPQTPGSGSTSEPNGTAHLKSIDFEVRDTQWLAALAAAARPDLDSSRTAVTGGSYGGGESWLQASQASWSFPAECVDPAKAPAACRDANGAPRGVPDFDPPLTTPLRVPELQVAVPKYPWTDMAYSLAPHGHPGPWPSTAACDESAADDPCYASAFAYAERDGDAECPPRLATEQARAFASDCNPVGVLKQSYVQALATLSSERVTWECRSTVTPSREFPAGSAAAVPPHCIVNQKLAEDPESWYFRARHQGDPYDGQPPFPPGEEDPLVDQIRRGTTEYRSSYYQDEAWRAQVGKREVAVYAIQGWTDDLFPAVDAFRQYKYLKRLDPRWPVSVALADVGHSRAQNKPQVWRRLNAQAWQMLQSHINGSHRQQTVVQSEPTTCPNDGDPDNNMKRTQRLTATTPEGLSEGRLRVTYQPGQTRSEAPVPAAPDDPDNLAAEPAVGSFVFQGDVCRTSRAPEAPRRYTGMSQPLQDALTYVGLGTVEVRYELLTGQPLNSTATLEARLWDVPPGGEPFSPECGTAAPPAGADCPVLMTRGAYRIDVPAYDKQADTIRLPLFGNQWQLKPGHHLRLDLTQTDNPTWLPSNQSSVLRFDSPRLYLPTREADERELGCMACGG